MKVHVGSDYGNNLWQLDSPMANQYYSAWRSCVKLAWQVKRGTQNYLVDHLLADGLTSVRTDKICQVSGWFALQYIHGGQGDVQGCSHGCENNYWEEHLVPERGD